VLADKQMELYRQAAFTSLTPMSGPQPGSDERTYWVGATVDWTCVFDPSTKISIPPPPTPTPLPPPCPGTPANRSVKLVSIEVHEGSTSAGALLFSESATFDSSTG
jgi:hypothetical protein